MQSTFDLAVKDAFTAHSEGRSLASAAHSPPTVAGPSIPPVPSLPLRIPEVAEISPYTGLPEVCIAVQCFFLHENAPYLTRYCAVHTTGGAE